MVEVMVAALLVALISGGVLMGFVQVSHLSGQQRQRAEATALAQQDQARLRGLAIPQLSGTAGNQTTTVPLNGTTYRITSKSTYISGTGNATCVAGQSGASADEVAISSSVSWPNIGTRPPVVVHSVVAPPVGGSVVLSATTPAYTGSTGSTGASGLSGMTATLTGPSPTIPLVTDSTGCAIFAGLTAGSYTLSLTPPTGYIDVNGNTTVTGQTPVVTATQTNYITAPTIPTLAQPGTITAAFTTVGATGATGATSAADQFSVQNTGLAQPRVFGTDSTATNNTFATTVSSGATVYPTATPLTTAYTAEAGGCVDPNTPAAGQVPVTVSSSQTSAPTLPEPALIILPYTSPGSTNPWTQDDNTLSTSNATIAYANPGSAWTSVSNGSYNGGTEHESSTANSTVTVTFTGNSIVWLATQRANEGYASVTLDGNAVPGSPFNLYSSTTLYKQAIYTSGTLTQGSHTLVITVTGNKGHSGSSGGTTVSADEFTGTSVPGPPILLTTKPNVIVTDTDSTCGNNPDYPPTQIPTLTGGALQYPGLPWGTYTVCVDNGTTGGAVHDTVTGVSNTSYTSGNPLPTGNLPIDLYSGGVGTYGTGPCQTTPTSY